MNIRFFLLGYNSIIQKKEKRQICPQQQFITTIRASPHTQSNRNCHVVLSYVNSCMGLKNVSENIFLCQTCRIIKKLPF